MLQSNNPNIAQDETSPVQWKCGSCGGRYQVVAVLGSAATSGVSYCPYCGDDNQTQIGSQADDGE
jgi:hypothetical protein